jgi:hypothetical protein
MQRFAQRMICPWSLVLFVLAVATVNTGFSQAGSAGLAFLKLGVSGKGVSMGDATCATIDGAAATYYNPAGMASWSPSGSPTQILFTHKEWIQDTRTEFLGTTVGLGGSDVLGVSVHTTTTSDIEIRDRPGPAEGTFTARDFALGISYAREFGEGLRLGATMKYLYEKILVDYAAGFAFDVGAQYETPIDRLRVGLFAANIGSMTGFRSTSMQLPTLVRFGAAYSLPMESARSFVTLAADVVRVLPENRNYLKTGAEIAFAEVIAARAGFEFGSEVRGLSAGLGLHYGIFGLDYAFAPTGQDLGNSHTITVVLNL